LNLVDLIIFVIVIIGFILGFKDGIIRKLIGLLGLIIGLYLAVTFAELLGEMYEKTFDMERYMADVVAGASIFLVIILIFAILKRLIHPFDKVNNFLNQLLGGIVGAVQMLFFISAVLYLLNIFDVPKKDIREGSLTYSAMYNLIPSTVEFVSGYVPDDKNLKRDNNKKRDAKNRYDSGPGTR
jgi:membrane protein required for colicin V production